MKRIDLVNMRLVGIVMISLCSLMAFGASEKFQRITEEQGLPHNNVYCTFQDHHGFIWIGTQDGVARYDGYQFVTYRHNPLDQNSLSESNFGKIVETPDGNLWFGTYGGGINRFDPRTGQFKRFQHKKSQVNTIAGDFINSMIFEKGKIWIGTTRNGVDCFDPKTEQFSHLGQDNKGAPLLSSPNIRTIFMDQKGILWVGTNGNGLDRIDLEYKSAKHFQFDSSDLRTISHNIVNALCMDGQNRLWIGTRGGGICFLDSDSFQITRLENSGPDAVTDLFINKLLIDRSGSLWIGTYNEGLSRMNLDTGHLDTFKNDPTDVNSLGQNRIESLYQDRSDVLWVGTKGGGLSIIDLKPSKFNQHALVGKNRQLQSKNISSITEDDQGNTWFGTDGAGLCRLLDETYCDVYLPKENSLGHRRAWSLCFDSKKRLWVGTFSGLNLFNRKTNVYEPVKLSIPQNGLLEGAIVNQIIEDHLGQIWVATSNGLFRIETVGDRLSGYYFPIASERLSSGSYISSLFEDHLHQMWVGSDFGLIKLNTENGDTTVLVHDFNNPDSISHNLVEIMLEDSHGNFWVGTGAGLNLFIEQDNRFIHFFEEDGLPNNNIRGMVEDDDGFLWISTNRGLAKFDVESHTFRSFDISDGLPSNDFNFGACFKSKTGRIYFGGGRGLLSFDPSQVKDNSHIPPVVLTSFSIRGKPLFLEPYLSGDKTLELNHKDNLISFEFSALDFSQIGKNHYAYKLEPSDREWIQCGSRNFGQYTNLGPGAYSLHVIGSNNDQVWNRKGVKLPFVIHPPFWATLWFRVLVFLLIVFLIFVFFQVRTRQFRKRNAQLEGINLDLKTQISKRKQAEEKLKSTRNYLSHVIDSLSAIVIAVDEKWEITQWNSAASRYTGISFIEALGRPLEEVLPVLKSFQSEMRGVCETQIPIKSIKVRMDLGQEVIVNLSFYPLVLKKLEGLVIHMDDVTELERKEDQLRQAQKMETVGNLAGGLAHDFNNFLGGIIGTTSLLPHFLKKIDGSSKDAFRKHVSTIESSALKAANIVKKLLSISRKQELNFSATDLNLILKDVVTLCETTFDKRIQIETKYADKEALVLADSTLLEQILLNLCVNASHAMTIMRDETERMGGQLKLSLQPFHADPFFCDNHSKAECMDYWEIQVSDTGVGMDANTISKIFDPFFTTKEHDKGTGLGLSMAYNIVEQHNGFIDVVSEPGRGTTFILYLPLYSGSEGKLAVYEPSAYQGEGLILIVDDDSTIRQTTSEILTMCGYDVLEAADGLEGIRVYKERFSDIRAVFLDLVMPNASGEETYEELKTINPNIKVILTSGYKQDKRVQKLLDLGIQCFLQKPYTMNDLATAFHDLLKE